MADQVRYTANSFDSGASFDSEPEYRPPIHSEPPPAHHHYNEYDPYLRPDNDGPKLSPNLPPVVPSAPRHDSVPVQLPLGTLPRNNDGNNISGQISRKWTVFVNFLKTHKKFVIIALIILLVLVILALLIGLIVALTGKDKEGSDLEITTTAQPGNHTSKFNPEYSSKTSRGTTATTTIWSSSHGIWLLGGAIYVSQPTAQIQIYYPNHLNANMKLGEILRDGVYGAAYAKLGSNVYLAGGVTYDSKQSEQVQIFNIDSRQTSAGPKLLLGVAYAAATEFKNRIYFCGGHYRASGYGILYRKNCYSITDGENQWSPAGLMKEERSDFAMVTWKDGIFAIGGKNSGGPLNSVEKGVLNGGKLTWTNVQSLPSLMYGLSATVFENKLFACGGLDYFNDPSDVCVLYNDDWWHGFVSLKRPRAHFGLVTFGGDLYAFGGAGDTADSSVEIYDSSKREWKLTASFLYKVAQPVVISA